MIIVDHVIGGSPADHHARELPQDERPHLWWFTSSRGAIVLGSAQSADVVDRSECERLDLDIVTRRSGGGLVLVGHDREVWLDVLLPSSHPLWVNDISLASAWLGRAWCDALLDLGVGDTSDLVTVHEGPMEHNELSPLVCFAGRAPGEVFIGRSKAVGISQRRTREWVRFQCALSLRWEPKTMAAVVADSSVTVERLSGLGTDLDLDVSDVVDAVQRRITERLAAR
jgi:lipoate-protein ligase A